MAQILRSAQGAASAAVAANKTRDTPKSPKPTSDPEVVAKIEVGPIMIAVLASGDFLIYTQRTEDSTSRYDGEVDNFVASRRAK